MHAAMSIQLIRSSKRLVAAFLLANIRSGTSMSPQLRLLVHQYYIMKTKGVVDSHA